METAKISVFLLLVYWHCGSYINDLDALRGLSTILLSQTQRRELLKAHRFKEIATSFVFFPQWLYLLALYQRHSMA